MGKTLPSGKTIMRATLLTAISLIVLGAIGSAIPQARNVPVIGAVFR